MPGAWGHVHQAQNLRRVTLFKFYMQERSQAKTIDPQHPTAHLTHLALSPNPSMVPRAASCWCLTYEMHSLSREPPTVPVLVPRHERFLLWLKPVLSRCETFPREKQQKPHHSALVHATFRSNMPGDKDAATVLMRDLRNIATTPLCCFMSLHVSSTSLLLNCVWMLST